MRTVTIQLDVLGGMLRLLARSWHDINYEYSGLTREEQDAMGPSEFQRVLVLMEMMGIIPKVR
jgi:hypothetical protein